MTDDGPVYQALSVATFLELSRYHVSTIDYFLSSQFGRNFQREVPLFLEIPEFPFNTL